jgi:RimJ/RimL family protein N-acetyltransferase
MADHPVLTATTARGEPITLRCAQSADVDAILAACTDEETRRWTLIPLDFDLGRAESFVANAGGLWERGEGVRWVVADSADACVGLFDLHFHPQDPGAAEVFFIAAPAARGGGYMSAALRAVAVWAITEREVARVEWQALVGNEGSLRVAERAGFQFEGVLRLRCDQRGTRHHSWVSSMTRDDL